MYRNYRKCMHALRTERVFSNVELLFEPSLAMHAPAAAE